MSSHASSALTHANAQTKANAFTSDPNHGCCFLSATKEDVEGVHLVRAATSARKLKTMGKEWRKYSRGKWSINTRYNVLPLRLSLHPLFQRGEWIILPEPQVIKKLARTLIGQKLTAIEEIYTSMSSSPTEFTYYAVPISSSKSAKWRTDPAYVGAAADLDMLRERSMECGSIRSHIHPHLVIMNSGPKLRKYRKHYIKNALGILKKYHSPATRRNDVSLMMQDIIMLCARWTGQGPRQVEIGTVTDFLSISSRASTPDPAVSRDWLPIYPEPDAQVQTGRSPSSGYSSCNIPRPQIAVGKDRPSSRIRQWLNCLNCTSDECADASDGSQDPSAYEEKLSDNDEETSPEWLKRVDWESWVPSWTESTEDEENRTSTFSSNDWCLYHEHVRLWKSSE